MQMSFQLIGKQEDTGTNRRFLLLIQQSALLALKDMGVLTPIQHRHAEEALKKQCREDIHSAGTGTVSND